MNDQAPDSRREAMAQLTTYVVSKIKAGVDDQTIIADLESRGLQRETAQQLVARFRVQAAMIRDADSPAAAPAEAGTESAPQPAADPAPVPEPVDPGPLTNSALMSAITGGVVAAVIGGMLWGLIAGLSGYEIGYLAWGIGLLSGFAVLTLARGHTGKPLQIIAVASALMGIIIGKYVTFVYVVRELAASPEGIEAGAEALAGLSLMSLGSIFLFVINFPLMLSGFDLLWILLAVGTAWGIPKTRVAAA